MKAMVFIWVLGKEKKGNGENWMDRSAERGCMKKFPIKIKTEITKIVIIGWEYIGLSLANTFEKFTVIE